jgi:hypothetical protein
VLDVVKAERQGARSLLRARTCPADPSVRGYRTAGGLVWSVGDDGAVSLVSQAAPDRITYDPPLLVVPVDLRPGTTWTWTGQVTFDKAGREPATLAEPQRSTFEVEAMEVVVAPAGRFPCLRVRERSSLGREVVRWFSAGVGLVQEQEGPPGAAPTRVRRLIKAW